MALLFLKIGHKFAGLNKSFFLFIKSDFSVQNDMAPRWLEEVFIAQADMSIFLPIAVHNPTTLGLPQENSPFRRGKIVRFVANLLCGKARNEKKKYSKD